MAKLACVNFDLLSTFPQKIFTKGVNYTEGQFETTKTAGIWSFLNRFSIF